MAKKLPKQPEVNIGLVGHVDHGKTTLTKALSGVWTDTHSEELKRGISIKLGYADTAFYKTKKGEYYASGKHPAGEKDDPVELERVVSFVDAPGHETLMAIMIGGASIMDGALLMVAANETCPQPQTREHLMALEIAGINNIIVVQNKIDLISKEKSIENHKEIKDFLKGTIAENAPIIPISAHHDVNLDVLISTIEKVIPTPERNDKEDALLYVARSFDVNRPGTRPNDLQGGIIGGSIVSGQFKVGDEIEIGPGRRVSGKDNWIPIESTISSIKGGGLNLDSMNAGGLCGMATKLDPNFSKSDNLSGQVVAIKGNLPPIRSKVELDVSLLKEMVGAGGDSTDVYPLRHGETLMVTVATAKSVGTVSNNQKNKVFLNLKLPICANVGSRLSLSRRVGTRWRLIGHASIVD
ncbi:MAG: translation initiation factor IF-2 subunit gamma [Euryarchaeota archaeon]|nr:translation initiation factor IF-2 subunit gamma [Euryarchaeota archaeon]